MGLLILGYTAVIWSVIVLAPEALIECSVLIRFSYRMRFGPEAVFCGIHFHGFPVYGTDYV